MQNSKSGSTKKNGGLAGMLKRISTHFQHNHVANLPGVTDQRLLPHAAQVTTAAEAVQHITNGDHVFVGTACATPRLLVEALEAIKYPPADIEFLHFLTDNAVPKDATGHPLTRYRHRTFFVGNDIRTAVKEGLAEYVPMSIARVPGLIEIGRISVDVALIQVSMPDQFGYVSFGVSVDIALAAVTKARLVIAEVNPFMPRTMGDSSIHISEIDYLVEVNTPVTEYLHHVSEEKVVEQIARYISSIIEDGSTLQIGLGRYTNEALKYLTNRHDLGIHSEVITDGIIPLIEQGVLTGQRKTNQPRKIVTSFAMGSRRLYDLLDCNALFSFQPIDTVCDPSIIAAQYRMVSVTQAFAMDLTGQVCTDQLHGEFYGGIAAQGEFLRGASRSEGGKAIICLASTEENGEVSCIRSVLNPLESVTVARTDVHYVITEFGIAYLFGKSIRERAVALIQIAHPKFRPVLFEEAKQLGYLPGHQVLQNLQAYPVEEELIITLNDNRSLMLRPVIPSDAEGIRQLFHHLPKQDVYTRFFHHLFGLSNEQIQRLCNMNFDSEVAFVAVIGNRENPQIVGQCCYYVDYSTNLAETAFMVHPQWQRCGLGAAMQNCLIQYAKKKGVRGFVANILSTNTSMIKLAQGTFRNVSMVNEGTSTRVTVVF